MRYQSWDILIFPERSKVPLQEFKTQCLVTRDHEHLQNPQFASIGPSPYYSNDGKPLSLLPIVTSFISSLVQGDDFRISIHSWERPKPSKTLEGLMQLDDTVMFEARVYLDSVLKTRSLFDHRTMWPFVIETADSERTGEPEQLRFPVFHSEILKQSHWDAGESYGRIKIIIAEGLCREMRATDSQPPAFERFRDVVGFAFQHAPPNILEFSGIAWPNEVMWKQAQKLATQSDPYAHKPSVVPDHNAHAHSPRRASLPDHATAPMHCYNNPRECAFRGCTHHRHFASPQHQMQGRTALSSMYGGNGMPPVYLYNPGGRNTAGTVDDPFLVPSQPSNDSKRLQRKPTQSSGHDVSMPDYRSGESRAVTDMSGVSYDRLDFERQVNHAAVEEIIKALSPIKQSELLKALSPPSKSTRSGSMPPENSPAEVASTAPLRSNIAARDKTQSIYTDLDNTESATDQSPPTSRTTSNEERLLPFTRPRFGSASPADNIQSKKERDQTRRSMEQPSGDRVVTIESSGSKSRSPLIESLNITRQRSNSAGSKRKRSNSKLDQVTSAEQSPSGVSIMGMSVGSSIFSPYHVVDDDDTVGGSRRRALPSA